MEREKSSWLKLLASVLSPPTHHPKPSITKFRFVSVLGIFNLLVVLSYCKEIERSEKRKQIVEEKKEVHVV